MSARAQSPRISGRGQRGTCSERWRKGDCVSLLQASAELDCGGSRLSESKQPSCEVRAPKGSILRSCVRWVLRGQSSLQRVCQAELPEGSAGPTQAPFLHARAESTLRPASPRSGTNNREGGCVRGVQSALATIAGLHAARVAHGLVFAVASCKARRIRTHGPNSQSEPHPQPSSRQEARAAAW